MPTKRFVGDGAAHATLLLAVWRLMAGMTFSAISSIERRPSSFVRPIVTRVEKCTEIADLLAEGKQVLNDLFRGAPDHDLVDDRLGCDRRVGRGLIGLEEVRPAAPYELRRKRPVIVRNRDLPATVA